MDEFEQALNHVYNPPTQSRSPRAITLMVAIHAALLTHIQDRSEKPSAGRTSATDSLYTLIDDWEDDYNYQNGSDEKARVDGKGLARTGKTSGAEEDTQAHVWRAKLGGVKAQDKNPEAVRVAAEPHAEGEWRAVNLLEVDDHVGWEKVLVGCLIEVREESLFSFRSVLI